MTAQDLKNILDEKPFVPFKMVMADGTAFVVKHPEMVTLGRTVVSLGVDESMMQTASLADDYVHCSIRHILWVETNRPPDPSWRPNSPPGDFTT